MDSAGTIQTQYTYEPFGKATATGAASSNAQKYTAREDDGTGPYYYRARYYSPSLQRFISEDPIGIAGGDLNARARQQVASSLELTAKGRCVSESGKAIPRLLATLALSTHCTQLTTYTLTLA